MGIFSFLMAPLVKCLVRLLGPILSVCDVGTWKPNREMKENCNYLHSLIWIMLNNLSTCKGLVKCLFYLLMLLIMYSFYKQSDQSFMLSIFTSITCPYDLDLIDANSWALLEHFGWKKEHSEWHTPLVKQKYCNITR